MKAPAQLITTTPRDNSSSFDARSIKTAPAAITCPSEHGGRFQRLPSLPHSPVAGRKLADELFPRGLLALRSNQMGAARDRAMQAREELRAGLDPVQQPR